MNKREKLKKKIGEDMKVDTLNFKICQYYTERRVLPIGSISRKGNAVINKSKVNLDLINYLTQD